MLGSLCHINYYYCITFNLFLITQALLLNTQRVIFQFHILCDSDKLQIIKAFSNRLSYNKSNLHRRPKLKYNEKTNLQIYQRYRLLTHAHRRKHTYTFKTWNDKLIKRRRELYDFLCTICLQTTVIVKSNSNKNIASHEHERSPNFSPKKQDSWVEKKGKEKAYIRKMINIKAVQKLKAILRRNLYKVKFNTQHNLLTCKVILSL